MNNKPTGHGGRATGQPAVYLALYRWGSNMAMTWGHICDQPDDWYHDNFTSCDKPTNPTWKLPEDGARGVWRHWHVYNLGHHISDNRANQLRAMWALTGEPCTT